MTPDAVRPDRGTAPPGLSICFVAHNAWGAISGGRAGFIGGIENQQTLMARWLADRGHDVSMITWDEGQSDGVSMDGVSVWKTCGREEGFPGLRFIAPRWSSLLAAMSRADASIYYQNTAEEVTGQAALWARLKGRRFVFSVASDPDCDPALPALPASRERILYRYGLRHANAVVAQTQTQRAMLQKGFGVESVVLPMPCVGPGAEFRPPAWGGSGRVGWVGRIAEVKRLEWLLDVAARLPHVGFDVAGTPDAGDDYVAALMDRMSSMANVTYRGRLARGEMAGFYRNVLALCCTSKYEGFPNTFLEAWSHGVPVVSTVDPDGLVRHRGLGKVASNTDDLAHAVYSLLGDRDVWAETSARARRYFVENHDVDAAMAGFEGLFREVEAGRTTAVESGPKGRTRG